MKASVFFSFFLSLFLLASPIHAQNGSVIIPSTDSSATATPQTGATAGSGIQYANGALVNAATPTPWSFSDIEALSLFTHNFTTGETGSGATLGIGVAAHYASVIPLGAAFVINYHVATDTPNLFGFSILGQVQHFVLGPQILFLGKTPQYCIAFGGSTSIF